MQLSEETKERIMKIIDISRWLPALDCLPRLYPQRPSSSADQTVLSSRISNQFIYSPLHDLAKPRDGVLSPSAQAVSARDPSFC
ncbi:MAG: hypothetical protein M4579_003277 [Chaenotheca gracillima]|nr:MAG: hypothetical protein M4579_003277 [Chaenotheca gracillima]